MEVQAAKLMAVHVKVLEGNAGGIDLVDIHDLLQPLPHLVLAPELRLGVVGPQPTCVTRHHQWTWIQTSVDRKQVKNKQIFFQLWTNIN